MDKDWERAFTVPISVEQGETATVGNSNDSSENRNHSQTDPSESLRQQKLRLADDIAEQLLKNNLQNLDNEAKRLSSAPLDPSFEGNTEPKRFTTKIEITPINPFESRPNVCSDENDAAPSIFHDDRTFSCARQAPVSTDQRPCSQYPGESTQPPIDDKFTHNGSFLQNDDKSHTGECQSQHINRSQPQVRHIPIFVEGRPEPILPTNEVPSEKKILIPDQTPLKRTSDGNSASGVATTEMSSQSDQNHEACLEREIPVETQVSSATISQSASAPTTSLPMSVNPPSLASVSTLDSHQCVKQVQQEVDNLTRRVEKYTGTSRNDKEYLFLDEMLTRNLIKLDTIEVENNEQLRAARKNVIESIQKSIALLESKIPVPTNENTSIDDSSERIGELKPASAVLAQNCETILEVDSNENGKTKA